MKKTYIIPSTKIISTNLSSLLYTASLDKGTGPATPTAKQSFFDDFDSDDDASDDGDYGFYTPYKI